MTEPTEEQLDSVRSYLSWYGGRDRPLIGSLRQHLKWGQESIEHWPQWAKDAPDEIPLTKGGFAHLLWHTFHKEN